MIQRFLTVNIIGRQVHFILFLRIQKNYWEDF